MSKRAREPSLDSSLTKEIRVATATNKKSKVSKNNQEGCSYDQVDFSLKVLGCSGCLIEAIERGDELTVHQLLSEPNVKFDDTFWTPYSSISLYMASFSNIRGQCFPLLSARHIELAPRYMPMNCSHSQIEENLYPEQDHYMAISTMLTAMLHTTAEFNVLQILVDSQKFDMSEPLVFHWKHEEYECVEDVFVFFMNRV